MSVAIGAEGSGPPCDVRGVARPIPSRPAAVCVWGRCSAFHCMGMWLRVPLCAEQVFWKEVASAKEVRKREGQRTSFCAHLAAVLALALPAGFCGDGLVTGLTFGPVAATAPFGPSNFGALGLSW